jgi:hypothetical protein
MWDQFPLSLFRTNLYLFRNSLIALHSVDPSYEPLIQQCANVCRLVLNPPSFNSIPELPEITSLLKCCTELCDSLPFSLNDLLTSIGALRDAVEPTSPPTSEKCTSLIETLRTGGNLERYWDFFDEHFEVFNGPEFSEILKKIEWSVLAGQVIERGKQFLKPQSPATDVEMKIEKLMDQTTRLSKETRELQFDWTRFEEYLSARFARVQAKVRTFEQKYEEIADAEKSIVEVNGIRLQNAEQFDQTRKALAALRERILAEKQRRADARSEGERLRRLLSEAQEKRSRLEGEGKAAPKS